MHIVITGGMGCGKSTITNWLKSRLQNYHFYDMDERVRLLCQDKVMQDSLITTFGTCVRREISDIVFANEEARNKLYRLMNATIFKQVASQRQYTNVLYDIPLFFEHPDLTVIDPDVVICVTCSLETQRSRIKSRDGFSDEKISSILALQLPLSAKSLLSDYVITTDDSHEESIQQLESILTKIGV